MGVLRNARPDDGSRTGTSSALPAHGSAASTQSVDVDRSHFMAGEFVEITNDGRVVRLSGTGSTKR